MDFFIGIRWPPLRILLINAAKIDDNVLSDYVVSHREGWDAFTSAHPSIQISAVLFSHDRAEMLYLFKGPPYLPHPSANTSKNRFCVDILLGNRSVEF